MTTFWADLRSSARTIRSQPPLWRVTLVLGFGIELPVVLISITENSAYVLLGLPCAAVYCGWVGTQRTAFWRSSIGQDFADGELWATTQALFGRFAALSILTFLPYTLVLSALEQAPGALAFTIR